MQSVGQSFQSIVLALEKRESAGGEIGTAAAVCRRELTVSSAMVWWWTWTRVVLAVHVAVGALGVVLWGEGEVAHACTYQC